MDRVLIADPDDPRVAEFMGLRDHDLRRRRESPGGELAGIFIAEGDLVVERAVRAGYRLRSLLVDATRTQPLPVDPGDAPVFAAGPDVVRRITGMGVHRGVMASCDRRPVPPAHDVVAGAHRLVVLEGVTNPTNLGVIARSAVALGIDGLLLDPSCSDPLYRRASRVAMGEVFALPYARVPRAPEGFDVLRDAGFEIVALTPDPAAEPIDVLAPAPDDRVALVLGAEAPGLRAGTLAAADRRVRIPLHPGVDSLNVAAAAAIACYVLARGRP
ncbi:MAG: rRNA methyltransferase [Acidimicrobiales bacterium]|nr:rRNA methyltransferase [Acidimicrobiales bacterium]